MCINRVQYGWCCVAMATFGKKYEGFITRVTRIGSDHWRRRQNDLEQIPDKTWPWRSLQWQWHQTDIWQWPWHCIDPWHESDLTTHMDLTSLRMILVFGWLTRCASTVKHVQCNMTLMVVSSWMDCARFVSKTNNVAMLHNKNRIEELTNICTMTSTSKAVMLAIPGSSTSGSIYYKNLPCLCKTQPPPSPYTKLENANLFSKMKMKERSIFHFTDLLVICNDFF